jgi:catechol 2,3-dioxygenase
MSRQLGHVHLKVQDSGRAIRFYTDVLDLDVTEEVGDYAFLSFGDRHHDIALQEVEGDSESPVEEADVDAIFHGGKSDTAMQDPETSDDDGCEEAGLYHAAFEIDDEAALGELYRRLRDLGVETTSVDHGISKALYFEDPSGNGLEAYVDTRTGGDEKWQGENDRFDPAVL